MKTFQELYEDLLRQKVSVEEPLPREYDPKHLDCLLHPEEYASTWINDQSKYTNTYGDFGLKQSVKAGDHALASYAYDVEGKSFLLTQLSYGNGNSVAYEYDD